MSHILFCPKILSSCLLWVLCVPLKLGLFTGFMATLRICDVSGFKTCYQTLEKAHETQSAGQPPGYHAAPERWALLQGMQETQEMKAHGPIRSCVGRGPQSVLTTISHTWFVKVRRVVTQRGQVIWEGFGMGNLIMCGKSCYLWGALTLGNDSLPSTAWPHTMVNESS